MKKRITALLLTVLTIIMCFTGCTSGNNENEGTAHTQITTVKNTDDTNFKLSYTQADSLDPFKAATQNNQVLASLVFESLFDLDEGYQISTNIATGYAFTDSKTIKVDINPKLTFSDRSKLDIEDVAFSAKAAMKSPAYASSLTGISYFESSGNSLIVHLKYENPYAVNLLTFPICSTKDDKNGYPVGSGKYRYQTTKEGKTVLTANKQNGFDPYITTINLVNIASADSIDNAVNIGNISYAFRDMSADTSKRLSCAKKAVNMNNLIYIGVNSNSGITSNAQIRRAVSLAVDREVIAQTAYFGYADTAQSTFNPHFKSIENINLFSPQADTQTAKQAVIQSGLSDDKLSISILINYNENRQIAANLIKTQLESIGFKVKIDRQNYKNYLNKIKSSSYDLYIGEVKLSDDMSLYPFLSSDGQASYGINLKSLKCDDYYKKYLSGEDELGKFILAFNDEMPYIPLVYKKGMICYSKALKGDMQGYYSNFFSNIDSWNFNNENNDNTN